MVDIPGSGQNKINAAYAIGGPALAIRTVEAYLGIQVNHLVEVNFENFPQLIDALGGITYSGDCVISRTPPRRWRPARTVRSRSGSRSRRSGRSSASSRSS